MTLDRTTRVIAYVTIALFIAYIIANLISTLDIDSTLFEDGSFRIQGCLPFQLCQD